MNAKDANAAKKIVLLSFTVNLNFLFNLKFNKNKKGMASYILYKLIADEDNMLHLTKIGAKPISTAPSVRIRK